jgi:hypothetical protein
VTLLQRLIAERVNSCSWRPELPIALARDEPDFVFRGVKKRVNRLGVIGGGFFSLRLPVVDMGCGGGDEDTSDGDSWSSAKSSGGEDIASMGYRDTDTGNGALKMLERRAWRRWWRV